MSEYLGCELIAISAVTLKDGRTVCDECPDWRHECKVRHVEALPTREDRVRYLAAGHPRRAQIVESLRELVRP